MARTINPNLRAEPTSHPHKHPTVFDSRSPHHDRHPVCPGQHWEPAQSLGLGAFTMLLGKGA